jgi:hypothetical protein
MTTNYALVYPTADVSMERLARAALAVVGAEYVTTVSGAGSQALRVPEESVGRVYEQAGLAPPPEDPSPPAPAPSAPRAAAPAEPASGPEEEGPGPDAPKAHRPAAKKTAARKAAAKKTAAKKATSARSAQTKEGDDQ